MQQNQLANPHPHGYQAAAFVGTGGGAAMRFACRRSFANQDAQGHGMAADTTIPPGENPAPYHEAGHDPRRRDWIKIGAVAWIGVGGATVLLPLLNQMNPSADVLADATTELDVSAIQPGMAIKAFFRKQPLFVRNLTPAEVAEANKVDAGSLRDPQTLAERTKPGKQNWLITMGVCTHLGCVPLGAGEGEDKGPFGGYFCPCHGSAYDTAGRIRQGPAPKNLQVPDYNFTSDTVVTVG